VRPYILCAIFKQIDLETPGNFKKFLNIQAKIHEETLEKRTLGTIGTHDLDCIKAGELYYEAIHPDNIEVFIIFVYIALQMKRVFFEILIKSD
jgi:hypothetical protein